MAGTVEAEGVNPERAALLISRLEDGAEWLSGGERLSTRFSPASTSKVPHTLIALETGAVASPDEMFKWDGRKRFVDSWNEDQDFATAFRRSTVWVYQTVTPRIGSQALADWLSRFGYGNADTGTPEQVTSYWLEGPLAISAREKVDFLSRLARQALPLSDETYAQALPVMLEREAEDWKLYAKTGWYSSATDQDIGWYVGWLEQAGGDHPGTYVFAFNMDMDDPETDIAKRKSVVMSALEEIGTL